MAGSELDRFAELLMRLVRDRAIAACDRLVAGQVAGPTGERWRSMAASDEARRALADLVPDVVDEVLFALLDATDNEQLPLAWRTLDGDFAPLSDLGMGEMGGWLMGSPGWRHRYSNERFLDPFADLRLDRTDEPPIS